ncbi:MAG: PadR family transcriptional regulator [Nakamurella sp.]
MRRLFFQMMSILGDTKINTLGMVALGLLTEGPSHPYEMYQVLMRRREDVIVKLRPGSLYHAIAKLAESGFVRATGTERDGNRPERTTYEITRDGRHLLESMVGSHLAHPVNEFPIFPVAVAQAQRLPKADALHHFKYRLSVLEREVSVMKSAYQELIDGGKPQHVILDLDYLIVMRESEIAWLTTTITALESGQLEWTTA